MVPTSGNFRQNHRSFTEADDAALLQFWQQTLHGLQRRNSFSIRKSAATFLDSRYMFYAKDSPACFHPSRVMQILQKLLLCHEGVIIGALIKNLGTVVDEETFA